MSLNIIGLMSAVIVVAACTWTDIRERAIYNVFTYPAAIAGVVLNIYADDYSNIYSGLISLAIFLFFFLSGKMGAGDLKLAVALALLLGMYPILLGTLTAGVLTLFWGFVRTWRRTGRLQAAVLVAAGKLPGGEMPFGAVLGPATLAAAFCQLYF